MKKLFGLVFGLSLLLGVFGTTFACEEVNLDDGDVCIDIDQNGDYYTLDTSVTCDVNSCSMYCNILLPDNSLENVGACDGTFERNDNNSEKVKIYINLNNDYDTIEEYYDFDDGERSDSSSSSNDLDDFDFTHIEDESPDKDEWITVKIEAQDDNNDRVSDYDDRATLVFEYKDGSSWKDVDRHDIKIKSDDFNDNEDDLDSNGELEERFDNGRLEFEVWFENEDEYRITVKDGSANQKQTFNVGDNGSSSNDINNFKVTAHPDDPDKNDWIDINVDARYGDSTVESYDDDIVFKVYYKKNNYSYWIPTNSSTLFEINDDYNRDDDYNDGIDFKSSRDGEHRFNDFIRFKKDYSFKIEVEDKSDSNIDGYDIIDVGDDSSSNNDLDSFKFYYIEDSTPDKDKWITVKIKALNDDNNRISNYDSDVILKFERDNDDADDNDLKIKSDDFNEDENDLDSDGEINVNFYNGYLEFEVWFEHEDIFTITVEDDSENIDNDYDFDVGNDGGENSDIDGFTNAELDTVDRIYSVRPELIDKLSDENNELDNDNERDNLSDDLYDDMEDVLDDDSNRSFDDYDDFFDAFEEWYSYTLDVIH